MKRKDTDRSTVLYFVLHRNSHFLTPESAAENARRSVRAVRIERGWDPDPEETLRRALIWQEEGPQHGAPR